MRCRTRFGENVTLPGMVYGRRLLKLLIEAQEVMPYLRLSIKRENGSCDIYPISHLSLDEEATIKMNEECP